MLPTEPSTTLLSMGARDPLAGTRSTLRRLLVSDDQSLPSTYDLVAAGLYDPAAPDAAARLELLTYLTDEVGASIPELVQAQEEGVLVSFPRSAACARMARKA